MCESDTEVCFHSEVNMEIHDGEVDMKIYDSEVDLKINDNEADIKISKPSKFRLLHSNADGTPTEIHKLLMQQI